MDTCLLCLELPHDSVDCIYVTSKRWHDENIQLLIEQHFWPLETIETYSWICSACWFVLKEFHNFYIRIEEAHVDMAISRTNTYSPAHQKYTNGTIFDGLRDNELSKNIYDFQSHINMMDSDKSLENEMPRNRNDEEFHDIVQPLALHGSYENVDLVDIFRLNNEEILYTNLNSYQSKLIEYEQNLRQVSANEQRCETNFNFGVSDTSQAFSDTIENVQPASVTAMDRVYIQSNSINGDVEETMEQTQISPYTTGKPALSNTSENRRNTEDITPPNTDDTLIEPNIATDEEPITDDEYSTQFKRDPLMKPLFTKVLEMPKIFVEVEEKNIRSQDNDNKINLIIPPKGGDIKEALKCINSNEIVAPFSVTTSKSCIDNPRAPKSRSNNSSVPNCIPEPITLIENTNAQQCDNSLKDLPIEHREILNENPSNPFDLINRTTISSFTPEPITEIKSSTELSTNSPVVHREILNNDPKNLIGPVLATKSIQDFEITKDSASNTNSADPPKSSMLDECKRPITLREYDDFLESNFKIICDICHEDVRTFNELRIHFKASHNKRAYVMCCNKKFLRRCLLVEHIRWHCHPDDYTCKYCQKIMSNHRNLRLHEKHVHEKKFTTHSCDICGKTFSSSNVLKNHRLIHLSEEEKNHPCEECGKRFGSQTLLHNHTRSVHMAKYIKICDICGKILRTREIFDRHMITHKGEETFRIICDICGYKVACKSSLRRHKRIKHPEASNISIEYKCDLCPRISDSLSSLRRHVRYKHETERKFKCSICPKGFKKRSTLREHMASHTKIPLYKCPYCPMKFNSNANMHTHRKKEHPMEWLAARQAKYSDTKFHP
ncbi:uncharacterized protein LOC142240823 [Haematobia irritans]|uniref:uncharacterized protein LOC142240823 n=1 Tax=Haematobia irritans TaxID=7368 RepID=UPI003F50C099